MRVPIPSIALSSTSPGCRNRGGLRAEPTPAPLPIASEAAGIFLQLGAFSNATNAENFSARVRRELDWLKHPLQITGRNQLYRLQLGPFRDRAEANAVAQKIREALDFKPLVISR